MKQKLQLIITLLLSVMGVTTGMAQTVQEKELVSTNFTDWKAVSSADAATVKVTTASSKENITFTLHNTSCDPAGTNSKFSGDYKTGYLCATKNGGATVTTTAFASVTTLTYTHAATGGNRGWGLKVKGDGDDDWVTLSSAVANPAGNSPVTVEVNRTNVQLQWYNIADGQNAYMLYLNIKGNVTVTGEQYKVGVAANPAEGGTVSISPAGGEYSKGDSITITAKPNFGYKFINWTNSEGKQTSTMLTKGKIVNGNETYTANFEKVNTYELKTTVEGGANDYMISYDPAPTVVDGKNMYEEGTKVTMTASNNKILTFTNWSNGETAASMAITMNEDKSFVATYSACDFVVGWDMYAKGNCPRAADFVSAGNEAVQLSLIDADGNTYGGLDKTQVGAGGYEGRPGIVSWVNSLAIGSTYWQTQIDASNFTDLKVVSSMVHNYNAYETYNVEYSLDGTTWTKAGTVEFGVKKWGDSETALPADCNNQAKVYVRWIADTNSTKAGTTSNNDGACMGATYILGTAKLIDDGTAPVLVSSVPANDATGVSANGKVILTFDEKVKLTDNAKATLGNQTLTPTVSGKTVICEYKGLDYSSDYTFTLAGGSVSDLTDNTLADDITVNFQSKIKPVVTKALYDAVVATAAELDSVIALVNARADQSVRYRVFIKDGKYVLAGRGEDKTVTVTLKDKSTAERTYKNPVTYLTASNISFIGSDLANVTITNHAGDLEYYEGQYGQACVAEGIRNGDVLSNAGTLCYYQGLTIKTSMGDARGRDIAFNDTGNETIMKDACLWGYQDTYYSGGKKYYFEGGVIRGRTDYMCGKGDVYYNGVTLQQCGTGGFIAVPSTAKKYGYVYNNCYIKKETKDVTFYLGRPWGSGTPTASFINTKMDQAPAGTGWADMSGGYPKRFAEYNSYLTNGTTLDLSGRRTSWEDSNGTKHANDPILTIDDVNALSLANVMGQDDDWDPTAATEQASAPQNVQLSGNSLTWSDNSYVLGWVVFKNGKYAANVIEPSYTIDDATATWTVRAANEMGGLGEATTATVAQSTGDINGDGKIDNDDVLEIVDVICGKKVNDKANVKGYGNVNVIDVNTVISNICNK